jgi:hypothetical protein
MFKSQLLKITKPALPSPIGSSLEYYLNTLDKVCGRRRIPFTEGWYGDAFRMQVGNPTWVIQSLIANLVKEGEGATDLLDISNRVVDSGIAAKILKHAYDEARHCRVYFRVIDIVFPNALPRDCRASIRNAMPNIPGKLKRPHQKNSLSERELLDILIQVNLGEMRTRIHQKLMTPVLFAYCKSERHFVLQNTLQSLIQDEEYHIVYSGTVIGDLARICSEVSLSQLVSRRLRDFIEYTVRELGTQHLGAITQQTTI